MNLYQQKIDRTARKVGLFCNARDETHIKEWAAHHLLIGFDTIIIFDHKSKIPLKTVFQNFDNRVTIIRTELPDGNIKQLLMNNAINMAKKMNLDWFIYLDADEFLILNKMFKGVKSLLNAYSYGDSLAINWLMFGTNHLVEDPEGLILENYTKSCEHLDHHVKSFVRPYQAVKSDNPHYYHVKNKSRMLGIDCKVVQPQYCYHPVNMPFYKALAYIAHYVYQSEETYLKRKINIMADNGTTRANLGKEVHNRFNDGTNTQPQKYVRQIKEFLSSH
jgi:hypothetical protein